MPYRYAAKRKYSKPTSKNMAKRPRFGGSRTPYTVVRREPRAEVKYVDRNDNVFFHNAAGGNVQVHALNLLEQGTGGFQRIGRRVYLKHIHFQYEVQPYTLPAPSDRLRVSLIFDRSPTGTFPLYSEMFASRGAGGAVISDVDAFQNVETAPRFRILHSKMFSVGGISALSEVLRQNMDANLMKADVRVSLNTAMNFKGATTDLADCQSGVIYLVVQSVTSTITDANWLCHFSSRTCFSD